MATNRRRARKPADATNPSPTPAISDDVQPMTPVEPITLDDAVEDFEMIAATTTSPHPSTKDAVHKGEREADQTKSMAKYLIDKRASERQKKEQLKVKIELSTFQHFIQCQVCAGHGVYVNRAPHGKPIETYEWFSSYKGLSEGWYRDALLCQECYERGEETPLRVTAVKGDDGHSVAFRLTGNAARRFSGKVLKDDEIPAEVLS